ncbi:DUF1796 family putative cysteine peptidase [Acetobacteraceae bacterium KSS8]|uniref:DUF1796 family putative cysteine peptidase n=1 Tax=Endosaccharibacter trunci TaxID=2812733 RepID=A0ABT1W9Q6_9PROT|nr:DUF1796 family putative cysteine peptidase [Acetobacteraceae bacterium KSS8]
MIFQQVISLGGLCQASFQIKDRFGFTTSSPFDYIVTSLSSLKSILRTRGTRLGTTVHCETAGPAAMRKGITVFCSEYRAGFQHEFPRDENSRAIVTEASLESCRSKLRHKYDKMDRSLKEGRPTLLLRFMGHNDAMWLTPNSDDPRPVLTDELNDLTDIVAKTYPDLPFRLAFVYFGRRTAFFETPELDTRIVPFRLEETTGDWQGDKTEWDKVFSHFDFDLANAEHAQLEYLL